MALLRRCKTSSKTFSGAPTTLFICILSWTHRPSTDDDAQPLPVLVTTEATGYKCASQLLPLFAPSKPLAGLQELAVPFLSLRDTARDAPVPSCPTLALGSIDTMQPPTDDKMKHILTRILRVGALSALIGEPCASTERRVHPLRCIDGPHTAF